MAERRQVVEARSKRASLLCEDILVWNSLAHRQEYPRSLYDIVNAALTREYQLGQRRRGDGDRKTSRPAPPSKPKRTKT